MKSHLPEEIISHEPKNLHFNSDTNILLGHKRQEVNYWICGAAAFFLHFKLEHTGKIFIATLLFLENKFLHNLMILIFHQC